MTDINWNTFKAKFNERETSAFERLCYFLFCSEFDKKKGIFRFKNQVGLETEPIEVNGVVTGFQAKYYDTRLAENKNDIIASITKAKTANPELARMLVYTNQEFGESKKKAQKKPQYLLDIEKSANKVKVEIEWRVPSQLEVQLSLPANQHMANYFFGLGKNIVDFLGEISSHSENILYPIQSEIDFHDKKIKINRQDLIESIGKATFPVLIIAGEAGSGKTALIKDYLSGNENPTYVFKATEFAVASVSELFKNFGDFFLSDFVEAHAEEKNKCIIIDSAEKLSDLKNQDPFKEFLSAMIKNGWRIIFTTRNGYLEDLTFQLSEVYRLRHEVITVTNMDLENLAILGKENGFETPVDLKLAKLICNPFYLKEYLAHYEQIGPTTDIAHFKSILWQKKILNSVFKLENIHLQREKTFLEIVKRRCEQGNLYVSANQLDNKILSLLSSDEIIQFDAIHDGYFITHDIYEEWALDKIVDRDYHSLASFPGFFNSIGTSLPIRRAFRLWLSAKLNGEIETVKPFIEGVFNANDIEVFWKDELLISILLSEYASEFFQSFEKQLLSEEKYFLKKIIFLLRTACQEIDQMIHKDSKLMENVSFDSAYLITKPKGTGWQCCIGFIYKHISTLNKNDVPLVVKLLKEWTGDNKTGQATKNAALIALHLYQQTQNEKVYYGGKIEESLVSIFLSCAREIKDELKSLVQHLLDSPDDDRHIKNDDVLESILTVEHNAVEFYTALPEETLALAKKFWHQRAVPKHPMYSSSYGAEKSFAIAERWHHGYSPASALQTPLYWTLYFSHAKSIVFFIDFMNQCVQEYAKSGYDKTIVDIDVYMNGEIVGKQFISGSLWNMYRGSGSPVTPYMLQSCHMALERYFMEVTKISDKGAVEKWLLHLLKHTRSASISAVVTSIALAYPDDFFNVAAILFENYEFVHHDNWRLNREREAESIYKIGAGLMAKDKIHELDREATLKDRQRGKSLENQILEYQFFRNSGITEEEAERRSNRIQLIIDQHYQRIADSQMEENEKTIYRLMLARVDRRKMNPKVEQKEDGFIIDFNPELAPELKKQSEDAIESRNDFMRYTSLDLWASSKFENTTRYGSYPQYDDNPSLVISEVKAIIEAYKTDTDGSFYFRNYRIPPYACAVLITHHLADLSADDLKYCKHIITEFATAPFADQYAYQISDGVEAAIHTLPFLYRHFPEERDSYDMILLLTLFDAHSLGEYKRICDYAIESIEQHLYPLYPENAIRIFKGFYTFYDRIHRIDIAAQKARYSSDATPYSRAEVIEKFINENETELESYFKNKLVFNDKDIKKVSFNGLETTFNMIPFNTKESAYLSFASTALPVLCKKLMRHEDRKERGRDWDYKMGRRFFRKAAKFLLSREKSELHKWISPFVEGFSMCEESASFLEEVILVEDKLFTYEQFWTIWESLYPKIKAIANSGDRYRSKEILHNYFLAWQYWNPDAKSWLSLKEREKHFFKKCAQEMGSHPSVLYSIAKLINEIGSGFLTDGIIWAADVLRDNHQLDSEELDTNTVYYLEVMVRKYAYLNRTKLKSDKLSREKLFTILDFLVAKASVNAYLLREDLL